MDEKQAPRVTQCLHLHMLLWIQGTNLNTPDEIHCKILNPKSDFQQKLMKYLEGAHSGDFLLKGRTEVEEDVHATTQKVGYHDPTETLPESPPTICHNHAVDTPTSNCDECVSTTSWSTRFRATVNDLLLKSNIHKCSTNRN